MSGQTVNLRQSSSLIATSTTDGSGHVTLNVPAGTYDVEVVPTDSRYATYTASGVAHTCGQSTSISTLPASGYICSPAGCPCQPAPASISVTGLDPNGNPVSDTCLFGSPPAGYPGTPPSMSVWFGQTLHTGPGLADYYLVIACGNVLGGTGYGLNTVRADLGTVRGIWGWRADGGNTCSPFHFPTGSSIGSPFGSSWTITA